MATSRVAYKEKLLLESFQPKPPDLLIGEEINCGAYGVVHKGVFEDCPVAVKKIHKLLFDAASTREAIRRIITEFKKEADMLIVIQHPHVVRSLGAFYDPQKREPILVMELMAMNLREFIAKSKGSPELQESAQIRIIFQIALGIQYLHHLSPPLAHRDLNDKNVLLAEDGTAKIGDLGQAKYKSTRDSYYDSKAPGSVLFMPPETFNDNPHYTESVDIFSLGVLVVEVATHSFPSVGMMGIGTTPEVERRAKDLKKRKADHPLKPLVLNCLRNNYKSRPDIDHVICGIIRIFTRQLSVKDKEIEDLRSAVETKDLELVLKNDIEEQVSDKDRDIAHLTSIVEMKDRQKAELECDISAKNREIENLRKTVELKDAELQQKEGVEKLLHDKNREINVLQSVIKRKDDELQLVKKEFEKEYENPRGQVMAMEREWNQQKKELEEERARYVEEIEDLKRQIVSKECEQQQEKDKLEEQCQVLQARLVESETSFELRSTRLTESLKENVKHLRQAVHTVAVLLDGNQRSTMVAADFMKSHTSLLKGLGMGFHNYIHVENGTQRSNGLKPLDTKADSEIHMSLPTKSEQIQSRLHEDVPSMIHTHLRRNVFPNGVVKETMLTKPALNAQKIEEQPSVTGQTYDSARSSESEKPVADVQPADIHVEERLHDTRLNKSGVKLPGCKDADRTIDKTEHVSFPRHSEKENTKVMENCGSRDTRVPIEKHFPESSDQQPQDINTHGSTAVQDTHVPPFITKEHPLHSTTVKEANSPTTRGVDPVEIDRGDLEAFSAVCKEEKVSELKSKKALEEAKAGAVVHANHSGHLDKQPHTKTKGSTTGHEVPSDVDNQPLANLPGFHGVDSQVHVKGMKVTNLQRGEPEQGLKRTTMFIEDNKNDHKKAVPPSSVSTDDPVNHLTQSATHVKMNDDAPVTRKRSNTLKHTKEPKSLQSCQAGISNELLGKLRKWKQQADTNVYVSNDTNSEVPDNI